MTWSSETENPAINSTPISWYGWMDFGGLVRDSSGFGSLNYEWDFMYRFTGIHNYYANPWYSGNYADLFALIFTVTKDLEWLNLARSVYKDAWTYGTSAGEWVDIKDTGSFQYLGIPEKPVSGWLKDAMHLTKPMYYLSVEQKAAE